MQLVNTNVFAMTTTTTPDGIEITGDNETPVIISTNYIADPRRLNAYN